MDMITSNICITAATVIPDPVPAGAVAPAMVSVASYNIHKCVGTDGVFDPARILNVIREIDADIVALQEADARFGDRRGLLDLAALHLHCGYRAATLTRSGGPRHGWHGNVILFRDAIVHGVERMRLPGLEPRGAVVVDIDIGGRALRVIAAHLGLLRRSRAQQVSAILAAAQPGDGRGVIVMGDMNEWRMGSRSSLRMFGPVLSHAGSTVASYPSRMPLLPLDRVLVSRDLDVAAVQVVNTPLSRIASDHLPVRALVRFAPALEPASPQPRTLLSAPA